MAAASVPPGRSEEKVVRLDLLYADQLDLEIGIAIAIDVAD